MAQLNDTMVQGDLRVTGTAYGSFNGSFTGNLNGAAARLGSGNIGSGSTPIYLAAGVPTECSSYGGGSLVNLNGSLYSGTTATFYAPSSAGTLGNVLVSNGNGAPSWNSAAPLAKALSDTNNGSGADKLTIGADYSGVALVKGTSGQSNFYGVSITATTLGILAGANSTGSVFTASATTLAGTLSVSGGTACDGGLGVKSGFTMLNDSNATAAGIAKNGDISTYGGTIRCFSAVGSTTVNASLDKNGNMYIAGYLNGNLLDWGDSTGRVRVGWKGTGVVAKVVTSGTYSQATQSSYLISVFENSGIAYYKQVHASNVTVGNADACSGYKFVVGSYGSATNTLYFA